MNALHTLAVAALLAASVPTFAQQATPAPQAKQAEPDLATLRAMKSKIFMVQHRDPIALLRALRALGSGVNGSAMNFTNEAGINALSVRDFPENLAAIEEALKRLDVPSASQKTSDVELTLQVLVASKQPTPGGNVPEELQPIIKSLKGALAYRGYSLVASFVQRWDPSSGRAAQGKGQIEGSALGLGTAKDPSQLRLEWEAYQASTTGQGLSGSSPLQISKFQFFATEERSPGGSFSLAKIETSVNLKEGEHVVVGTSVIKDQGLVIVLTAKLLK